ncbi:hypothetical protein F2Q70_00036560 [Brassica cretica]|uniref:Uncharacterized protein n=1 Tax=Brassica cretica TaxID=69181 RepID=A0A8S9JSJ3_BRACR|nr:hypothetical protein F2Q70_00036560 [Brassica cretica]
MDLIELGELDNAREEEMGELIALDMRVTALEEKAVDEKNKIVDAKNEMEALDILLASLEAYVKEVGDDSPEDSPEDSHEDVKEREKKGKGVKWSVHTLDDNLNKTMSRSKKEK